jgi:hypothetical protein
MLISRLTWEFDDSIMLCAVLSLQKVPLLELRSIYATFQRDEPLGVFILSQHALSVSVLNHDSSDLELAPFSPPETPTASLHRM